MVRDGRLLNKITYTATVPLTVNRYYNVISDPVSGTTNPRAIPGALVELCIVVTNGGLLAANNVTVVDTLPGTMTYDATFGIYLHWGSYLGAGCPTNVGDKVTTFANGKATGVFSTIPAGESVRFRYRATIN